MRVIELWNLLLKKQLKVEIMVNENEEKISVKSRNLINIFRKYGDYIL